MPGTSDPCLVHHHRGQFRRDILQCPSGKLSQIAHGGADGHRGQSSYLIDEYHQVFVVLVGRGIMHIVIQQRHQVRPPSQRVKIPRHVHIGQLIFEIPKRVDNVDHHHLVIVVVTTTRIIVLLRLLHRPPTLHHEIQTTPHIHQVIPDHLDPIPQHARQIRHVLVLQLGQFLLTTLPNSFHPFFEYFSLRIGQLRGSGRVGRRQSGKAAESLEFLGWELGHDAVHHFVISSERFSGDCCCIIVVVVATRRCRIAFYLRIVARSFDNAQCTAGVHFHLFDFPSATASCIIVVVVVFVCGGFDVVIPLFVGSNFGPLFARAQIHLDVQTGGNGVVFAEELPFMRGDYFFRFGHEGECWNVVVGGGADVLE
mmetsp:Transcript_10325/g.21837  ORF Transcript_10325/g.21837 Transcript_10325/m.21837 type:complete len:368 (+) Transcript_10325:444-1547(+)